MIFTPNADQFNLPGRIVTFGNYLPTARMMDTDGAVRYVREGGDTGYSTGEIREMRDTLRWTRWINALSQGRKWIQTRIVTRLDELLEPGIALVVVPSHDPFQTDPPIRQVARQIAALNDRIDATGCLVRHMKIKRISYGGPSYASLHRQTIEVRETELFAGRSVFLLDDIARSGASLRACEAMLYAAGAAEVQAVALARVAQ